ncbi:D-glycero-alpha-D-manno-heptose-1,7-bisphosphate 7-phosphatase [Nonomuraea insulae]|uniref:D,D-heptose 1,7-bisphosphate phosphatase n=1 Tax=Nonomuraea insulae TaxID=1616787 RepID=A0ABW1D8Q1_9ACTN
MPGFPSSPALISSGAKPPEHLSSETPRGTSHELPDAVLFDRDGTLIRDVPYNGDPAKVEPFPGVRVALDRLRRLGVRLGVVTNQSGVGRGLLTGADVEAVNGRVNTLLGPFDVWEICPHSPWERCRCRKPAPGLVQAAAARLATTPKKCVVIGDIGADMLAASRAGARGILVPTPHTRIEEVLGADEVAGSLLEAVELVLR